MKYSIIITTYNREKYIKKCLDSILNQTVKNFKIIIVDDGSTDNTKKIVTPYLKHKNIKYYYKENTGVADSRNFGVTKVSTEYFLFIDSDDYISPTLMEKVSKYDNYDLLSFKSIKVDENGNQIKTLEKNEFDLINGKDYLKNLMINNHFFLVPWSYIYNTEFWNKHKFKYTINYVMEDTGLSPIIILEAKKIISIDYYGYYYVQTKESIMRTKNDKKIILKSKSILFQYDFLMDYLKSKNFDAEFIKNFNHYFAKLLLWYGSTLRNKFLISYSKELKKRKIADKLIVKGKKDMLKYMLCKTNYILYFKFYKLTSKKEDKWLKF